MYQNCVEYMKSRLFLPILENLSLKKYLHKIPCFSEVAQLRKFEEKNGIGWKFSDRKQVD